LERLTSYQAHGSDLLNVYGGGELADYLIHFVTNLNPNGKTQMYWPKYTNKQPKLLTFLDGSTPVEVSKDTFRQDAIKFVADLIGSNPI
jgi:acetylcholinesterase